MSKHQYFFFVCAFVCIIALITIAVCMGILSIKHPDYFGTIIMVSILLMFSSYSGFMYYYKLFLDEHDKINNI